MAFTGFTLKRANRPLSQGATAGHIQDQINFSGLNDQIIIAAVPGRKLKIHKLFLVGSAASNVRFYNGPSADNDPISGQMNFSGNWYITLDIEDFTLQTGSGKALILNLSTSNQVGGIVVYSLE